MNWRCRIGWHRWEATGNRTRKCTRCPLRQVYEWIITEWTTDGPR